jgi:hypothetical protein
LVGWQCGDRHVVALVALVALVGMVKASSAGEDKTVAETFAASVPRLWWVELSEWRGELTS